MSEHGVEFLGRAVTTRDIVADAYTHLKLIGLTSLATPLLRAVRLPKDGDEGTVELADPSSVPEFAIKATHLRLWSREFSMRQN